MGSGSSKPNSAMPSTRTAFTDYDREPSDIVDFKEIVSQTSEEIVEANDAMTKSKPKRKSSRQPDEYAIKYKQLEKAYHQCSHTTDLESTELTGWLEFLDTVAVIPRDHPDKLRDRWVKKLQSLGYVNLWVKWWTLFWRQPFAEQNNDASLMAVRLNFTYALRILWNCTEASASVCQQLVQRDGLRQIMDKLGDRSTMTPESLKSNQAKRYYVSGLLSIVHNCLRSYPPSKTSFRNSMGVKAVQPFTLSTLDTIKTKAVMIIAYGIQEHEQYLIEATDDHLQYIIGLTQAAINNTDHRCKCFTLVDLLGALNKLATNDENKVKIVKKGGLNLYVRGMREGKNDDEVYAAARGVWALAFPNDNRREIEGEPGCLDILQRLKEHKSIKISKAANGTLWMVSLAATKFRKLTAKSTSEETAVVDEEGKEGESDKNVGLDAEHIMLSYSWDYKGIVYQIKAALMASGFNVWIDEDHMSGSILESMAMAVERASVVILCISDSYKDSPSCRTEAEYAYRLRKPIVPVRTQPDYQGDGWLGALLGNQLYFDCTSEYQVQRNMKKIIRELQAKLPTLMVMPPLKSSASALGLSSSLQSDLSISPSQANSWAGPSLSTSNLSLLAGERERGSAQVSPAPSSIDFDVDSAVESDDGGICVREWTAAQVQQWLIEVVGLSESSANKFAGFDGRRLRGLKNMHKLAPNSFYQQLSAGLFALPLPDLLSLSEAVERLRL